MRNPDHSQIDNDALGLETAQKNRLGYQQNGYYLQDQIAFGGLNVLASLRFDDYRSVTTNYLQNGDKARVSQDRLTKRLGRFMPSTMVSRRLSAIRKVSHRYRRRVR